MDHAAYAVGQAVFIRTDTADFAEETVAFKTLDEMMALCTQPRSGRVLEKIIIFGMVEGEPQAVTLGFLSATKGQRPGEFQSVQ
jgi:hypothetical protein